MQVSDRPNASGTQKRDRIQRDGVHRTVDWHDWPGDADPVTDPANLPFLASNSDYPELEDKDVVAWGYAQCQKTGEYCDVVDVLSCSGDYFQSISNVNDEELKRFIDATKSMQGPGRSLRIFFLNTLSSNVGWLPGNFSIRPRTLRTFLSAGLSRNILAEIFTPAGAFAKMGPQCLVGHDDNGDLLHYELRYRSQCGWNTGAGFIQMIRTRHQTTYFCINYPSRATDRLKGLLKRNPSLAYRDFFVDALAAEDGSKEWKSTIGERRLRLLSFEKKYEGEDIDFDDATRQLHRLARDWNTLNQDCSDFISLLEFLQRAYEKYVKDLRDAKNDWEVNKASNLSESFEVLRAECEHSARWTVVYKERTNIRINLLFHLANQREARTSTQISISTAKVAEQTQRDSASMITMAAVTMVFLPGTFISAVLSTTFFDYGDSRLHVSSKWWILPASTIPTTVLVFAVWLAWRWWRIRTKGLTLGLQEKKKSKIWS